MVVADCYYLDEVAVIVAMVIAFFSLSVALETVVADEGARVNMAHFPVQIKHVL